MQIKLYTIPASDSGEQLQGFNAFLANHKVLEIEQKFFQNEKGAYWCFCVRYLEGLTPQNPQQGSFKQKIDYKEVLNEQDFAMFSLLRQGRKQLAVEDAHIRFEYFLVPHKQIQVKKYALKGVFAPRRDVKLLRVYTRFFGIGTSKNSHHFLTFYTRIGKA